VVSFFSFVLFVVLSCFNSVSFSVLFRVFRGQAFFFSLFFMLFLSFMVTNSASPAPVSDELINGPFSPSAALFSCPHVLESLYTSIPPYLYTSLLHWRLFVVPFPSFRWSNFFQTPQLKIQNPKLKIKFPGPIPRINTGIERIAR